MKESFKYTAKVIENIENTPGTWDSLEVGVFKEFYVEDKVVKEEQVGDYIRNYASLYNTFFPFQHKGSWYALYSKHYMYTSVMELPSCREIFTEQCEYKDHFCPVDYYVPVIEKRTDKFLSKLVILI